ncbi:MAG: hypothetical protein H6518_10360 [Microthrixaceae bacterium]|nr:hypothetical protein [Microthrixaceae bacterium]
MRPPSLVPVLVAVGVALAAAACGSDVDAPAPAPTTADPAPATSSTAVGAPGGSVVESVCAGRVESPATVEVAVPPLVEASGLAVSRTNDGVLWAHNDSGDSARVFAFGADGARLGTYRLDGVDAVDWEDLALGPAVDAAGDPVDDRDALYVADIGDNQAVRPVVTLHRVDEPVLAAGAGPVRARLDDVESLEVRYPDGPHDAEALLVDRTEGSFTIIAKDLAGGAVGVYQGPLAGWGDDPAVPRTLERVATFDPGPGFVASVTGADLTPAGDVLAVRTYGGVHLYERPAGASVADALAAEPCDGPVPFEAQGEAVALAPDGSAYYTLPEGERPRLSRWAP